MTVSSGATPSVHSPGKMERAPIVVIALAQMLSVSNSSITSLSVGGIVAEFRTPVTTIQSALIVAWLVTAAFMILGGRLASLLGARRLFRAALVLYASGMAAMATSTGPAIILGAQVAIGLATAALVPSLVALIAANYTGRQRVLALGIMTAASGAGISVALIVGGAVSSLAGWRMPFWLLSGLAIAILVASAQLRPSTRQARVEIDWVGAALSGIAIPLLTIGINNIGAWGLLVARPGAPAQPFGLSPAALASVAGLLVSGVFFAWMRRRVAHQRTPLLSPVVLDSASKRGALGAQLAGVAIYGSIIFLLPLYTQIILGISPFGSSLRLLPYSVSLLVASVFVARLLAGRSVRRLTQGALVIMATGVALCALAVQSPLRDVLFGLGLTVTGLGAGFVNTVLANVLVSSSPRAVSSEVGAVRGTANNLGGALGASISGVVLAAAFNAALLGGLAGAEVGSDLRARLNTNQVSFASDQQLAALAGAAGAVPEESAALLRINAVARLQALETSFFLLVGIALVAVLLVRPLPERLPRLDPGGGEEPD
jgi:MFS family permease